MRGLRALHACPDFGLAVDDPAGRGRRLHRRMRIVRDVILGLDFLVRAREGGGEVAVAAQDLPRLPGGRLHRRAVGLRIVGRMRAVVPRDLQRLAALDRSPGVVGDNRNSPRRLELHRIRRRRDFDDLDDAGNLLRLRGVVRGHLAPHDRRPRDDGVLLPRQANVLAVFGATGRDVEAVDDIGPFLADVAELRRILETQAVGRRDVQLAGVGGEFPIAELLPGGLLNDLVVLRLDVRDWDAPALGRSLFQHHARCGANLPHRHEAVTGRTGAVGVLIAVLRPRRPVAWATFTLAQSASSSSATMSGIPVRTPCPHFGAMADDGDGSVGRNRDEDFRIIHRAVRHAVGAPLGRIGARESRRKNADGEHESAGCQHAFQHAAAADVLDARRCNFANVLGHVTLPQLA